MSQTPLISLVRVSKKFGSGQEALSEITAQFHEGAVTYVTGHSGAGKTTLLRLIFGAEKASRGKVLAAGRDIGKLTVAELPRYRRNVGVVFQSPNLISRRTIFENVALPLLIDGEKLSQVEKRVRGALSRVYLAGRENLFPYQLSIGEQQRVGLARSIVRRPIILIADEPTGNLDPGLSRTIFGLLSEYSATGAAVIVASHDINLVRAFKGREFSLSQGRVVTNDE
jgi:cell division transport system ATP-binding protein